MKKTHEIKLNKEFVEDVMSGRKNFEIRENDRGYQAGDHVKFIVANSPYEVTDKSIEEEEFEITYVLNGWGLKNGYVVFGISRVNRDQKRSEDELTPFEPADPIDAYEEKSKEEPRPKVNPEKKEQSGGAEPKRGIDDGKIWALAHARVPWSAKDIAEEMNCSVATVYNRLAKMRKERGKE